MRIGAGRFKLGMVLIAAAASAVVASAEAPPFTTPPSTLNSPEPDITEIVRGLASSDFAVREAGQRKLETVSWQHRPMLVKLAEKENDAEVKSRLMGRILQIDEQLAIDPPPISLHVKNAEVPEVAAALSQQLGMAVVISPTGDTQGPITLNMEGSLWDICGELAKKNIGRIVISRAGEDNRQLLSIGSMRIYDRQMGFAAIPTSLQYLQRIDPQAAPGADRLLSRLTFQYTIIPDPRMKIIAATTPRLTSVTDDQGNNLLKAVAPQGTMNDASGRTSGWTVASELQMPAQRGNKNKLVSIRGEGRFEVQVTETRREINEVEKHVNEPVIVGMQSLTVTQWDARNRNLALSVRVMPTEPNGRSRPLDITLQDANGLTIWSGAVMGMASTSLGGTPQGPFKLTVIAPDHTKTITVPFEFRDIPLPPG